MGAGSTDLLAWRRATAETYARVRAAADPAEGHRRWADERAALMRTSPVSAGLPPPVAPYDPAFRTTSQLHPSEERRIVVGTATDGDVTFDRLGHLETPWGSLDVWWLAGYGGGVWIPVRDTSPLTYGGGRYLYDTVKGADLGSDTGARLRSSDTGARLRSSDTGARLRSSDTGARLRSSDTGARLRSSDPYVVDLNFLYNPSCAYDERWACPLAPEGNRLAVPVPVGELTPTPHGP